MDPLNFANFSILAANWRDLWPVVWVEQACFGEDAWPLLDILLVLFMPGVVRLKVVLDDKIVGFAAAEERSGAGWITTIGVLPEFRRRGIARVLLQVCEERIRTSRMRLCVRRDNVAAQQLYLLSGYHQVEVWARYYRGGEDALVMEKGR